MGKVFRINKPNATQSTFVDWHTSGSTLYNQGYVNAIADTTVKQHEITSIPSPFARIELVKEAFNKVAPSNLNGLTPDKVLESLSGTSIYHKMVSDTLDVAQIFFSYPSMKDKVEIVVWDRNSDLQALANSSKISHQIVAKTLDMFLQQDGLGNDPYNFSKLQNIYILKYKGQGQKQMHIIGATSPATLFFSTANNENSISNQLCFGTDYAFDSKYASLDKRDPEFIKYLFAFRYSDINFNSNYPEVANYLDAVYYVLDNNLKNEINQIQQASINVQGSQRYIDRTYGTLQIDVTQTASFQVEINGIPFHVRNTVIEGNSDFEIQPSKNVNIRPLVLPVVKSPVYDNLTYYGSSFGRNINVPYSDSNSLATRRLPGLSIEHPYLTISDFLEDKIVKLPSAICSNDYFDGNYIPLGDRREGYLIPVKSLYFDYFTIEDLRGQSPSGKNTIEIKSLASGVEVTLRIPVQKGQEIEYKRIYTLDVQADEINNKGAVVLPPDDFGLGIFPPVKFANASDAHYRIVLTGEYNLNKEFVCDCYGSNGYFKPDYVVRNVDIEDDVRTKTYLINNQLFDFACVRIKTNNGREKYGQGLVVPKFRSRGSANVFSFAIDFGTSNTHIEYTNGADQMPQPFDFTKDSPQLSLLFNPDDIVRNHLRGEFIPESIGSDSMCQFPMRTVLNVDRNNVGINESGNGTYVALGNASPAFMYNKMIIGPTYNDYIPNLKWSRIDQSNTDKIRCYIESLFLMIRTKVLQEGGSLSQTQIKWFYPISMSTYKKNLFEVLWNDAYHKFFNSTAEPIAITESIAPYRFFQKTRPNVTNIVTVDIGGGTTDIVVADTNGVKVVSSMRFAADAIFGNTLVGVSNTELNGIIKQHKDEFINNLDGIPGLKRMLMDMTANDFGNSSEVASFLFSLSENDEVKNRNLSDLLNFNSALQRDGKQKVVFFIFYTSIIYHLAKLMKKKGLDIPSNIAFSGNGSKVVSVLSPSTGSLEKLTTCVFKLIYGKDVERPIKLIINSINPKEATCKGGLFLQQVPHNLDETKVIMLADKLITNETYYDAANIKEQIANEVADFNDFISIQLAKEISFYNEFGIDKTSFQLADDCFNEDLKVYIEKGIELKLASGDVSREDKIEETLFFYPIIGVMNDLSHRICNLNS